MAEINGKIVLKALTKEVSACLRDFSEATYPDVLEALFDALALGEQQREFCPESDLEEGYLASESVSRSGQYTVIEPFGDEWLNLLQVLLQGHNLEFWAHILHEHGVEYFISLVDAKAFSASIDLEEGELDDEEIQGIEQSWRATVPPALQHHFDEDIEVD